MYGSSVSGDPVHGNAQAAGATAGRRGRRAPDATPIRHLTTFPLDNDDLSLGQLSKVFGEAVAILTAMRLATNDCVSGFDAESDREGSARNTAQ